MATKSATYHGKQNDQIVAPISSAIKARVETLASQMQVSRAEIVRQAVNAYLDVHESD